MSDQDLVAILPEHIDSTMIGCFRACPQKFRLEFVYGLRGTDVSVHLHAGAAFASALEHFYHCLYIEGMDEDEALMRTYPHFLTQWGDFTTTRRTAKTRENMWHAVTSYISTYPPKDDWVQPYLEAGRPTLEYTFAIPLLEEDGFPLHPNGGNFLYSGRFDLLGRWHDKPVVRDEKTTGRFEEKWAEQWDLRSQFLGYCWACQQFGLPVDTVVVRGVAILQREIQHREAIKVYSQFLISRWYEQLRRDMWRLRSAWDNGYFDFNLAGACTEYGGCQFRDICASTDPEAFMSSYTVRRWNPLLKNPVEGAPRDLTVGLETLELPPL